MLERIYYRFHRLFSQPDEKGEYSAGYWQNLVREKVGEVCRDYRGRLLEVGCGEGLFLKQLMRNNIYIEAWAVDKWDKILHKANERLKDFDKRIKLAQSDVRNLPFMNSSFDLVICINVFFNMDSFEEVKSALFEIARVLKPAGRLIFDFRNQLNLLLKIKYSLAKYYDLTTKSLPLRTYKMQDINLVLDELPIKWVRKIPVGFPQNKFAPIFIIEAQKR